MSVIANCNLTANVVALLAKQKFGLKCFSKEDSNIFLQSYINSLGCPVKQNVCIENSEPCDNVMSFLCKFYIFKLNILTTPVGFNFNVDEYHQGQAPYQYSWSFDDTIFELVPGNTAQNTTLKLRWKNGNIPSSVSSVVSVTVQDKNGCIASESCEVTMTSSYQVGYGYTYQTGIGCF